MNQNFLFVGSNPSFRNLDPNIPFEGTKSFEQLKCWAKDLGIERFDTANASNKVLKDGERLKKSDYDLIQLSKTCSRCVVIALGGNASKALSWIAIPHFKLPHPSGRNRALNDKEKIKSILKSLRSDMATWGMLPDADRYFYASNFQSWEIIGLSKLIAQDKFFP